MGGWVSKEFIDFVVSMPLSIVCVLALIGGWSIEPESSEHGITDAGRRLLRARSLFAGACAVVIASTVVLYYCGSGGPPNSPLARWFNENPFSAPLALMISSGLSGISLYLTLDAKGEGGGVC